MWPSPGVWVFRCYQSFLMPSSHYARNDHIDRLSIKTNYISSRCVLPCFVTRQMFQTTSLTKHGGLFTHSLTSFISFTPSLVVKGLPKWDFSCRISVEDNLCFTLKEPGYTILRITDNASLTQTDTLSKRYWKRLNRPFAWWRHFTAMTRILQIFAFLCKLGLSLFKPHWGYQI